MNKVYVNWQDIGLNTNFVSCPDMAPIPEFLWYKGQPDNADGRKDVTAFYFTNTPPLNFGHEAIDVGWRIRAFCEVRCNKQLKGLIEYRIGSKNCVEMFLNILRGDSSTA